MRDIQNSVPTYDQLLWPTLKALGGSGTNQEIVDKIIELEGFSDEVQRVSHSERETKIEYNAAWARTYLKKVNAVNNSQRGVWVLLEVGENFTEHDMLEIPKIVKGGSYEGSREKKIQSTENKNLSTGIVGDVEEELWKDQLLDKLKEIDPYDFERLCQLILRESGFTKVEVTKKSGDGGIDGVGIFRVNLLSFHVSFQCKRYKGAVSSGDIRDFRGAFVGRGDKGLFITTGMFTQDARKEASRDGAPAIDLIDGEDLCELLKDLKLGVSTELIEKVTIDEDWFDQI